MSKVVKFLVKPVSLLAIALALLVGLLSPPLMAQTSSQLGARISRLESENISLRSRVNRLENSISRLGRGGAPDLPVDLSEEPAPASAVSDDPMFERLATLVIETRQQVQALERRVAELEGR